MALLPHTHTLSGGVEGGKTHTKVDSMMFSRVIYICNARKTSPNTKENWPHAFPRYPGKYLASASLSYSKSLVWSKTTKLERERGYERGASVASWKVAGAWWAAWLPAWVVIWRERGRERERERRQAQLVPRWNCSSWVCVRAWVCVCVCDVCVVMCGPSRQLW